MIPGQPVDKCYISCHVLSANAHCYWSCATKFRLVCLLQSTDTVVTYVYSLDTKVSHFLSMYIEASSVVAPVISSVRACASGLTVDHYRYLAQSHTCAFNLKVHQYNTNAIYNITP